MLHDTSGNSYYFGVSCPGFHHSNRWLQHFQHDQENFTFFSWFMNYFEKKDPTDTRWVPTNYKWGRNPYKYDSTVITPITNIFAAIYRGPITPHLKLDPGPTFSPQIRSSSNERTALTTTNRQLVTFFRSLVWFEKWLLMDIILNHLIWYDMIWYDSYLNILRITQTSQSFNHQKSAFIGFSSFLRVVVFLRFSHFFRPTHPRSTDSGSILSLASPSLDKCRCQVCEIGWKS